MKHAFAVIGANFGDEGKGLMTDYFCSQNKKSLNIRFNGGAQAGHTVVTPDGKRHVFSHIGSGTFSGADTYLSEFFTLNPIMFMKEHSIIPECEIYISDILIVYMFLNVLKILDLIKFRMNFPNFLMMIILLQISLMIFSE